MIRLCLAAAALLVVVATAQARVYELRTYHCFDGKLEALKARFRDHTVKIFTRHGIENVGYWVPQDPVKGKNTLIYIVAHPSREKADQNWKAFQGDPEWQKVRAESEKDGRIVEKIDSEFLDPTDFSQLK